MGVYTVVYGFFLMLILSGALFFSLGASKHGKKQLDVGDKILIWLIILYLPIMVDAFIR